MASCILQPAYGHTSFSIPHFCRTTSQKVPHKAEHPRPWDTAAGRGMCVWWWIETSDGHNRGRTLNWLTDPSLRQRKGWPNRRGRLSISPLPPPAPKHTGDLLHSNDPRWVKSGVMKRRDRANIGVFLISEAAEWMTVSKWQRQRTYSRTELQR